MKIQEIEKVIRDLQKLQSDNRHHRAALIRANNILELIIEDMLKEHNI